MALENSAGRCPTATASTEDNDRMNEAIPSPVNGAPMRADWAARITDVCNQMVTSGMAGTLVRDGAGAF